MKRIAISGFSGFLILLLMLLCGCQKNIDLESFVPKDPDLALTTNQIDVSKVDSLYKLRIASNLPWRAKSNVDWITINDTTDAGISEKDSLIRFRVAKNPTVQPRSGTLTVWITDKYEKVLTVNQAAGDPPPVLKRNVYVKAGAAGTGDSWGNAISLSAALALDLSEGDIIHIAAGTYYPENAITGGSGSVAGDKTFEIRQNITLIGGYPANATTGAVADASLNTTILDGNNTANHVVTVSAPVGLEQKVNISGLTIQKGNTSTSTSSATINGLAFSKTAGGGVIVGRAIVEFSKCIITDNTAWAGGAGIYAFTNATVILKESVVKNNTVNSTGANGGGLFFEKQSDLFIYDSTISTNGAGSFAGALYQYTGAFHIYNTTVDGNGAGFVGSITTGKAYGGIYLREGAGELVNCTISGNTASNIGGGVGVYGTAAAPASLQIISCTITGNRVKNTSALGGGVYLNAADATVNIYNSIVSGNTRGATGTETVSDVEGVAAAVWSKKFAVVSSQVFDANGLSIPGATFDFASMFGDLANNGGVTRTIKLQGSGNPAMSNGMTAAQLVTLGGSLSTAVPASIISFDQIGESRSAKAYMGALVK